MAHRCSLQSLFSSFSSSSSSSFVFSLSHGLCFMPSSRSFFFFFFHLLYRRSNGSDFSFNRKKKTQVHARRIFDFGRNLPKSTEMPETHRNRPKFSPKWSKGYLIPVCRLVRDFPSVPAGMERNS